MSWNEKAALYVVEPCDCGGLMGQKIKFSRAANGTVRLACKCGRKGAESRSEQVAVIGWNRALQSAK